MTITPEAVDAYKKLMTEPKEHGLDFPPLSEVFERTHFATAKHLIYEQYLGRINKSRDQLPKIFFYIVMDEMYGQVKADDGNIGYCVRINQQTDKEECICTVECLGCYHKDRKCKKLKGYGT